MNKPPRKSRPPERRPDPRAPRPTSSTPQTHWGPVAKWYDELVGDEGNEYQREVILPGIFRMLGMKDRQPGKEPLHVLDLACGQGVLCRKLATVGCDVLGIDAAEPLILAARKRNEADQTKVEYRVADATTLLNDGKLIAGLKPSTFDAITIVLAIQNITPLSPVWHACRELLRPAGTLIVVMMHPAFRVPRQSDWTWDEKTGSQGRVVRQYLSSTSVEIQTHPGLAAHGKNQSATTHFHRPLQAYINTMGNAGLLIDHIEEWPSQKTSESGPRKAAIDKARKEIPMFLALRSRRV